MTISRVTAWITALAAAVLLGSGAAATAPAGATPSDDNAASAVPAEVRAAAGRLAATGELTAADRATLRAAPRYAAMILDPDRTTTSQKVRPAQGTEVGTMGGPGCWIGERSVSGHYVSGGVAYTYTYRVDWCENASAITSVHYRQHRYSLGSFMVFRGVAEDWVTPLGRNVQTKRKLHIENCPPLMPCMNDDFPYVTWYLTAAPTVADYALAGIES